MKSNIPNIQLILGDSFLAEEAIAVIKAKIEKEHAAGEVSFQTFYMKETPLDDVLRHARTLPFMTAAQIFHLREVDQLKEKKLEALTHYLEKPAPESFLLFEAESLEATHPLLKLLSKKAEIIRLEEQEKKSAALKFIKDKLKQAGKTIAPKALERLGQEVGDMPAFLETLLVQLVTYAGEVSEITEEMVEAFEENWQKVDIFQWVNAIVGKKRENSLILFHQLLEENEGDLFSLMGLLHWQIKRFWLARRLMEEGRSESTVLRKCKISPKQASYFMRQVRQFELKQLEDALEGLFQLDWKLKTGQVEGPIGLETWLVETTS